MRIPINVNRIVHTQKKLTDDWHKNKKHKENSYKEIYNFVVLLHLYNYTLWHLEDEARNPKANPQVIANVKQEIDMTNQKRNDTIEQIDECIQEYIKKLNVENKADAKFYTETIGSVIDRLSILALKIYHMGLEALRSKTDIEHIKDCNQKLFILKEQKNYLVKALTQLVKDVFEGEVIQFVYRQFKMYNDPKLNPKIYKNTEKKRIPRKKLFKKSLA
jgi:hypothetical protein